MSERAQFGETGQTGLVQWGGMISESYTTRLEWPGAYAIYDEMRRRDPTIRSILNALTLLARTAEWYVEPASDLAKDREIAEFVEECLHDMSVPIADAMEDALSCVWFGWSWLELVYKRRPDGRVGWQKWAPRRQSSLERWDFDATGGVRGMVQRPAPDYREIRIPIEKSLHFRGQRDADNPEGFALGEGIYEPWYRVKHLLIISGIGWQRSFVGLPVFEFQSRPDADDVAAVAAVGEGLTVDERQYVSVPDSVKFRLESAENAGAAALLEQIKYERRGMMQTALADFLDLGTGQTGSWALGSDKSVLFLMAVDGLLGRMAQVVSQFGIRRLCEANGLGGRGRWPRLAHKKTEKPALGMLGQWLAMTKDLLTWGDEDEDWLRRRAGMPVLRLTTGRNDGKPEETAGKSESEGMLSELAEAPDQGLRGEVEAAVGAELAGFFEEQKRRVLAAGEAIDDGFWEREQGLLAAVLLMALGVGLNETGAARADALGGDWMEVHGEALTWLQGYTFDLVVGITETTRESVRRALEMWLEAGGEVADLARLLEPTFGRGRAERIAATEVTRMYEEGGDMVRTALGLPRAAFRPPTRTNCRCWTVERRLPDDSWVVVWQTARDERVSRRPLDTPWGVVAGDRALQGVIVSEGPWLGRRFSEVAGEVRAGLGE